MRVAVLQGGRSFERSVSLRSGARVEDSLERAGHEVLAIDVGPDLVTRLRRDRPAVAFVALHGQDGEDGSVQELLDLLAIPYTGSGPAACMRCWDKALAKHEMTAAGLPTPDFVAFDQPALADLGVSQALSEIGERLAFPLVVKPARQGSALGIKVAAGAGEVPSALLAALSYDSRVLFERFVAGREVALSVVQRGGEAVALPPVEAIPRGDQGYDFSSRYSIGEVDFVCPAALDEAVAAALARCAVAAFDLFGCRGFARVDFIVPAHGDAQILEINTIPGLTETSLLPIAADNAGVSFDEVVSLLVEGAVSRFSAR